MNALVTGADGFIGSHLCSLLVKQGFKVNAFCQYNSLGSIGWLDDLQEEVKNEIEIFLGDVRDYESILPASNDINVIFHLASLISIPYSYISPKSYLDTNVYGTLNILNLAKNKNIKVIHTSTSETYGTAQYVPINESHPLSAQSPYAASKISADQLALSFHRSYDIPVTILRPFNTYGPRQSTRAIIPTIITQLKKNKGLISLGSLSPTRDFNFVEDTCMAFYKISLCEEAIGKVVNSSSNFEISMRQTLELISDIMDIPYQMVIDNKRLRPDKSEVNRLFGCNKLIKSITDWKPTYAGIEGFKIGLEKTIDWFNKKENYSKYDQLPFLL